MKTVSDLYKSEMSNAMRNRSYAKVFFENIDTGAATDGDWETSDKDKTTEFDTVDYAYDYDETFATFERNRWVLDGSLAMLDTDTPINGYLSDSLSGADGVFSSAPTLIRVFTSPSRTIPGLTLTFDTRQNTHPIEITVDYYFNGNVVDSKTERVTGNQFVVECNVPSINEIRLKFNKTLPYTRARLEHVLFGIERVFTNEDIVNTNQKHDIDPITRRLPKESFSFSVIDTEHVYDPDNPIGMYNYVDINSPVYIQYGYELSNGHIEWVKADKYILNGKPKTANSIVTFSGTGMIGSMKENYYKDTLGEKTFYDVAENVLLDADLTLTSTGGHPWVIDESLRNMSTTAVLPITTHMNCLQLIAHACRCKLFTDDDNIIHIEPLVIPDTSDIVIDFDSIKDKGQTIEKIEKLKRVDVNVYNYVKSNEKSTLYEATTTERSLHIEFNSPVSDITITGTVVSYTLYGRAIDIVLDGNSNAIKIEGYTYNSASSVITYDVDIQGEIDVEDNALVTDVEMAKALATHIANYLVYRNTYMVKYRGNPELETGDVITMQTPYNEQLNSLVLVDEISFNGSLSGSLTLKGLSQ